MLWYYATSARPAARRRCRVKAASKKGCYTATAFDDNGKAATVTGLVWHIGSKKTVAGTTGTSTSAPGRTRACSCARRRPVRSARTP